MKNSEEISSKLPIKYDLKIIYIFSLILSAIITILTLMGIFMTDVVYSTDELSSFYANDILHLLLGLPILIANMWLTSKEKLFALLSWPGILLFFLYSYATYLFTIPFNIFFIGYLITVTLATFIIIALLVTIDGEQVSSRLRDNVSEKISGSILLVLAILFLINQFVVMGSALINETAVDPLQEAQWIVDFLIVIPPMIVGSILLIKQKNLGYVAGTGLFLVYSMLFLGVIPIMIYQAVSESVAIDWIGIIIVFVSGFVCFLPLAKFIKHSK
ncbi:MAG: hypothetical protein KAR35_05980 [Candidatus Heimdallarchaeota archaeon]|nr:hypothetical protein [Candidatus Heimdallarchaeota archaeon]MCK5048908.1 hypothetical protein [Candidatus Heimdallarchaeota archaeon]